MENIYLPAPVRIADMRDETPDVRTFTLEFVDESVGERMSFEPGQFGEYSVFGAGECTFCIASSPTRLPRLECSFKLVGKVTGALRACGVGDVIGFRGPYGNWFPVEEMKGKNIVFVGGGIGMAPVRSIIEYCLDNRQDYGDIAILNGARTVSDIVYKHLCDEWERRDDVRFVKTVDPGGEEPGWDGKVGLIPPVLEEMAPSTENAMVILCGPPIMIKFTLMSLDKLGFSREQIVTTLENRMKCGLGKCGRCNVGPYYVCKDGPVFTAAQIDALPPDM
jgi:sulfhydrogenase subunit gamma (sulfur reductase)